LFCGIVDFSTAGMYANISYSFNVPSLIKNYIKFAVTVFGESIMECKSGTIYCMKGHHS